MTGTTPDPSKRFEELLEEFENLLKANEYQGAALRLAEMSWRLPWIKEPKQSKQARLIRLRITDCIISAAQASLEDSIRQIERILSIGDKWNEDEILLLLMKRIDIEMLLGFLQTPLSEIPVGRLEVIDGKLVWLSESRQNKRPYRLAVEQIKRNWNLPINARWLEMSA